MDTFDLNELFRNNSIKDIKEQLDNLELKYASNKEELAKLANEHYVEIHSSTNLLYELDSDISDLTLKLDELKFEWLKKEEDLGPINQVDNNQPIFDVAEMISFLVDAPEQEYKVWNLIETHEFFKAASLCIYSNSIFKYLNTLKLDQLDDVLLTFPVIQTQMDILRNAEAALRTRAIAFLNKENMSLESMNHVFQALHILDDLNIHDFIPLYLESKTQLLLKDLDEDLRINSNIAEVLTNAIYHMSNIIEKISQYFQIYDSILFTSKSRSENNKIKWLVNVANQHMSLEISKSLSEIDLRFTKWRNLLNLNDRLVYKKAELTPNIIEDEVKTWGEKMLPQILDHLNENKNRINSISNMKYFQLELKHLLFDLETRIENTMLNYILPNLIGLIYKNIIGPYVLQCSRDILQDSYIKLFELLNKIKEQFNNINITQLKWGSSHPAWDQALPLDSLNSLKKQMQINLTQLTPFLIDFQIRFKDFFVNLTEDYFNLLLWDNDQFKSWNISITHDFYAMWTGLIRSINEVINELYLKNDKIKGFEYDLQLAQFLDYILTTIYDKRSLTKWSKLITWLEDETLDIHSHIDFAKKLIDKCCNLWHTEIVENAINLLESKWIHSPPKRSTLLPNGVPPSHFVQIIEEDSIIYFPTRPTSALLDLLIEINQSILLVFPRGIQGDLHKILIQRLRSGILDKLNLTSLDSNKNDTDFDQMEKKFDTILIYFILTLNKKHSIHSVLNNPLFPYVANALKSIKTLLHPLVPASELWWEKEIVNQTSTPIVSPMVSSMAAPCARFKLLDV